MVEKRKRSRRKVYSLVEIKDKYLPNRDIASLEKVDMPLTRDSFLDMLKKVSRPQPTSNGTSETSK